MPDPSLTALEQVLVRVDLDRPDFAQRDVRRLPPATWTAILASGLVRESGPAVSAECSCSWDVHDEDVCYAPAESSRAGRPYIHCPEVGLVWLAPEELRQWTVDLARLMASLAEALSCAGRVEELVSGRVWHLGRTAVAGRPREVFFARRLAWPLDGPAVLGGCSRFQAAQSPVVLVPQIIPRREVWNGDAPRVLALTDLASLQDGVLAIDRAYLESYFEAEAPKRTAAPATSFPLPFEATWEDVRLVVTDLDLEVSARAKTRRYTFAEAGFEDRRKRGVPDHVWRLLKLFALRGGVMPFDAPDIARKDRDNLKNLVSQLRRRLSALLQMPDDPFRPTRTSRRYEARFTVSTTSTVLLSVPAGADWEDVAIEELAPDRIRFTIDAAVRAGVRAGARDEDGGTSWEAAERDDEVSRTYDLATLGLAERDGTPNAEGLVLRELLRARGVIARPATDKALLALGARLSRMAQIPSPAAPFAYAAAGSRWTAQFTASSRVPRLVSNR